MSIPICGIHHVEMKWKEAGVSKSGKPYQGFWTCNTKNNDGSFCTYKPLKTVSQTPVEKFYQKLSKEKEQTKWDEIAFGKCKTLFLIEAFKKDMDLSVAETLAEEWAEASTRKLT